MVKNFGRLMTAVSLFVVGTWAQAGSEDVVERHDREHVFAGGDSSGGGNWRALRFKKSVNPYVIALRSLSREEAEAYGIRVSAGQLASALFDEATEIHILDASDDLVIDSDRSVRAEGGRIFEGDVPKTAYYSSTSETIYVGVDWESEHSMLALKEFLRTIHGVDAEEQSVSISSWYEPHVSADSALSLEQIEAIYQKRLENFEPQECEAAMLRLHRLVSRRMYHGMSYEEVLAQELREQDGVFQGLVMPFDKVEAQEVWDYGWVDDATERSRRIRHHNYIWQATLEARAGRDVIENVELVASYLDDPGLSDVATRSLGAIGHASAAEPLIAQIQKDIDARGADREYLQRFHREAFWAPQALGSLDYSRSPRLYQRAESILFRLYAAQAEIGRSTMLMPGLTALASTEAREIILHNIQGRDVWSAARAISTLNDGEYVNDRYILPTYYGALVAREERDFAAQVSVLAQYRAGIVRRGLSLPMIFADLTNSHLRGGGSRNGDVLMALAYLRPEDCSR